MKRKDKLDDSMMLFEDPCGKEWGSNKLIEAFIIPPFSVLDARQGYWRSRKRKWIELGIQGELGRGDSLLKFSESYRNMDFFDEKRKYEKKIGKEISVDEFKEVLKNSKAGIGLFGQDSLNEIMKDKGKEPDGSLFKSRQIANFDFYRVKEGAVKESKLIGTSIFDPVLCEIMFKWFCPQEGHILDPFAGEVTKGAVATYLDFQYTGIELREEQVKINYELAKKMELAPNWIKGDSHDLDKLLPEGKRYDFVFTSPPYYDLEIYSKSEKDGSAFETYEIFIKWYEEIFAQAVKRMNSNRFLAIKIGEIRDEKGIYRNFVGDNINIFRKLGLLYYNEIILITAVGSLPVRVKRQFNRGRKIGKTHQNILVFYKGDPEKISGIFKNLTDDEEDVSVEDL